MLVPVNACRVPAKKGPGDAPRPLDYVPASQTLTDSKVLRLSDENVCSKRREICLESLGLVPNSGLSGSRGIAKVSLVGGCFSLGFLIASCTANFNVH